MISKSSISKSESEPRSLEDSTKFSDLKNLNFPPDFDLQDNKNITFYIIKKYYINTKINLNLKAASFNPKEDS